MWIIAAIDNILSENGLVAADSILQTSEKEYMGFFKYAELV